jgi:ubiquinone/menaquinone biosynthesis C-methylase UbiE
MLTEDRPSLLYSRLERCRDQRRHIRIDHSGTVQLASEGRHFSGQAVNLSRNGMQVVVNLPDSYESVRSITFTLPTSEHTIELPCRIVRSEPEPSDGETEVLGLEFSFQGEAQLLLIENYIREMKQEQLSSLARVSEMRRSYRASCSLFEIHSQRRDIQIVSIDNISTEGLLVSFKGKLKPREHIEVSFLLPGDLRALILHGQVMYVINNTFRDISNAGIKLQNVGKADRARVRNFVIDVTSGLTVRQLHQVLADGELDPTYQISDSAKISSILETLRSRNAHLNVLFDTSLEIHNLDLLEISEDHSSFSSSRPAGLPIPPGALPFNAYCSFYLADGSYYFKTELIQSGNERFDYRFPSVIYQSEKRSYQRKILKLQTEVDLTVPSRNGDKKLYKGRLVDISWRGFLCELSQDDQTRKAFERGTYVEYRVHEQLGLDRHGVVRHLKTKLDERGRQTLQIGIEAGVQHTGFKYRRFTEEQWRHQKNSRQPTSCTLAGTIDTLPVRYFNERGQDIAALLNASRLPVTAPVVLIPPAFGKKKEALSPLVLTMLQNFRRKGKDLVTLRYDGIDRPGESYREDRNPERGSEMLHYRLSQGLADLRTSLEYVHNNPFFSPQEVILITFSMSSIDARKLLMDGQGDLVDHWISCMGIASAKTTIGNILGGIDIIGNYKMGVRNGKGGMLGYLVNFDTLAQDLIENKYAYMTDSRNDMSKVPHPVLWIYGSHDKWTESEEVRDIMGVKSKGRREVIEIPTGHNLRSSSDAIMTFKLITAYLYEELFGEPLDVASPDKEEMIRLIACERERLTYNEELDRELYWKNYLIGTARNSAGYDFYRNIEDFRGFLSHQAELLDPGGSERIADMGCGTGLLTEMMLHRLIRCGMDGQPAEIVAVDFIEDALAKTRKKLELLCEAYPQLRKHSLKTVKTDLEPSRLLPVKMLIENPSLGFDFLRNRIPGLRNMTVDLLIQKTSLELLEILQGCDMTESRRRYLEASLKDGHCSAVLDLNRAARFLKRKLTSADLLQPNHSLEGYLPVEMYRSLSCRDIRFEVLSFGDGISCSRETFPDGGFDKIAASLFISYIHNPDLVLRDFYRILKPAGLLLVSSMRPDCDISTIFTDYINTVKGTNPEMPDRKNRDQELAEARAMLNEAAALFTLEEDGYFHFFSGHELAAMLQTAGFVDIKTYYSLGNPAQAVIVTGKKPN